MVISNYKAHIRQFNDLAYEKLSTWLDSLITKFGVDEVAEMLQVGAENGNIVTYQIVYSQDKLTQYISEMLNYLPEVGEIMKEDIVEAFLKENTDFTVEKLNLPDVFPENTNGMLTLVPGEYDTDGFFICRMRRNGWVTT